MERTHRVDFVSDDEKTVDRVAIFYFSGTGNTWWVANELTDEIRTSGCLVTTQSIEVVDQATAHRLVAEADVIGFGYPIYGSDLPIPMKRFISELEGVAGKRGFVFCTQWLWSGDGARLGAELLGAKGYNILWGEHFHMPSNVSVSVLPFALHTDLARAKEKYLRCSKFRAKRLAGFMGKGRPLRRGFNLFANLAGLLQRIPYRWYVEKLRDDLGVDREKCVRCGLCVAICPAANLVDEAEGIMTQKRCVLCLRCYSFCPTQAFTYRGRKHNHKHGAPYRGPIAEFDPAVLIGGCKRY